VISWVTRLFFDTCLDGVLADGMAGSIDTRVTSEGLTLLPSTSVLVRRACAHSKSLAHTPWRTASFVGSLNTFVIQVFQSLVIPGSPSSQSKAFTPHPGRRDDWVLSFKCLKASH
jgi:hypothetical protein